MVPRVGAQQTRPVLGILTREAGMADAGLLMGWNRVVPGRETHAVELWAHLLRFLTMLKAEGRISGFEPVLLGAHGGTLNGFVMVRGAQEALDRLRNSDDFLALNVSANKNLDRFTVVRAHFGEDVAKIMRLYSTR
jgi:hypothetical protein